jgi:hypothetical protein
LFKLLSIVKFYLNCTHVDYFLKLVQSYIILKINKDILNGNFNARF